MVHGVSQGLPVKNRMDRVMGDSLRILLLEGSDADAQRVIEIVRKGGIKAHFYHHPDGGGIAELLQQNQWDLILSNVQLADVSVHDVLAVVRKLKLSAPVIVLSDGIGEEQAASIMRAGAHDFITKRNLGRLLPAIERELEESALRQQHHETLAALHESEEHFRQLMENIGGVCWVMDAATGQALYISPAFEEVWERPLAQAADARKLLLETVHPDDYSRIKSLLDGHGWLGLNADYRILLPDGGSRWLNTRSFPIRNDQGDIYRVAGLSIDITEHRHLAEEREMMAWALAQSADAVAITDHDGVILYVNAAFEAITGYPAAEAVGNKPVILKSGLHDERFYSGMWQTLCNGLPFTDIFINRRKNGELYYEAKTITPVIGANGELTHYVATGKDITDRLKIREQLHQLVHFDAVTGLANQVLLMERMERAILNAHYLKSGFGVMSVGLGLSELTADIEHESQVEQLMRLVAERLTSVLRPAATVARLENDDFVVLLKGVEGAEEVEEEAKALMEAFAEPVCADGYELFLIPFVGISLYPDDGSTSEALLKCAEQAMLEARLTGHGAYAFYRETPSSTDRHLSS